MTVASLHHPHRRVAARHGAVMSALVPLALVLAANSVIFALVWVVIYPMWGLARWQAAPSAWANLASLVLAVVAVARLLPVSRKAAVLVLPSVAWIGFATVLGFVALA